ncbi:MAG: four helix bundle protein [Ignavibacteriaceae bacterium]|jgi:four helix bundle protein|nr:four helix bundle protein [Ignavibacteriaceae bacterium]MCW9095850.1 four helix bundle protein [Ignavibacteriaceae bacterium]
MLKLEDLQVYRLAMDLAESIRSAVLSWEYFHKDTIGKQLVRSADSIAANISEGFGRYHFKENRQFCYFARGSLFETKTWIEKAYNAKLFSNDNLVEYNNKIEELSLKLNAYIKSIGTNQNK